MARALRCRLPRAAAWTLILALASVSPVVCLAGAWQIAAQDECRAVMDHASDANAGHLDCCVSDAPNFDVSLAGIATVPPPGLTLVDADPFGAAPSAGQLSSFAVVDSPSLKSTSAPTYLLDSVFRI